MPYRTSRDYQLLKKLLDEGKEIVCFTDFPIDNRIFRDVCKARKIGEGRYSVTCRGCEYASFWENHNYKWAFEDEMRMANIEFIEPKRVIKNIKVVAKNENEIDKVFLVNDEDSINMSRKLASELGIGVGISSGANFLGSVLLQKNIKGPVVTVFADDNKKYLSTDLSKPIDNKEKYISNKIKLLQYEVI